MIRRTVAGYLCAALLSGLWAGSARADDCDAAANQSAMNACAEDGFNAADAELNAEYRLARKAVADVPKASELLLTAQRAWVALRDAHCAGLAYGNHGGSLEPMIRFSCMTTLTQQRTRQLKDLVDEYGD